MNVKSFKKKFKKSYHRNLNTKLYECRGIILADLSFIKKLAHFKFR